MAEADEDGVARFMLRHFGAEARAAAMGIEIDAALKSEDAKMARWGRIGAAITVLEAGGMLDEFAAEAMAAIAFSSRRRRAARPHAVAAISAPAVEPKTGKAPYLRLVVCRADEAGR